MLQYRMHVGNTLVGLVSFGQGGVRNLYVSGHTEQGFEPTLNDFRLTQDNSVHMFWLFPQYLVITMGEIMFSVTGLEFSYSQVNQTLLKGLYISNEMIKFSF